MSAARQSASETLEVRLGERSYAIEVGPGTIDRAGELLAEVGIRRVVIVTNAAVSSLWLARLRDSLARASLASDAILVPDGETHKSFATLNDVITRLIELKAERSTALVALGGGVVGDLTGFAASIYQRGVPFVQVPTTLLAQVDSSVGGKTAINHPLGKNMIGAFWQPRLVIIDSNCLATLPGREVSAGLAEVVKYGAIRDANFFAWLERSMEALLARDAQALTEAIVRSCRIKAEIVAADEREQGERAILNFGHTFAHAIESGAGYGEWLHGEAVAAGMVLAARLSERVCGFDASDTRRMRALLERARLPVTAPRWPLERWLDLMSHDKKVESGMLRFIVLESLGRAIVKRGVDARTLAWSLGNNL
ncbi:MAG TPA: 3-dehydroquinate synthase [Casimicrobiaceae bacterium]|nr:3-dehydroquinate synthase [Casimicrobiaceae bacterium]